MNRIDRLFGLLTFLQSRKYTMIELISEKFNISIRTAYRDLKALCEQGIPLSFEPNKGYFVVNGYFLPPVSFSTDEANSLLLVEALVHGFTDESTKNNFTSALNKVKSVLKTTQKEQVEFLSNNIKLQVPACFVVNYNYLSLIQHAITSKNQVEIEYLNKAEQQSRRFIEPIGLIFYALSWHLIAWCSLRNDYRDFRVSRIASLKNTDLPFSNQNHMEVSEYMKQIPVDY
ncbi:WYL domain-containing protein [Pedobacter sp. HMF7647]|uniref:WYL domain-containing protein n=1 Tax=Hufsiella arboris TaxID=2695275 RepID=A0A7K1Y7X0_9SPHI|nr:YafY family protein [Hufsiella arboris]MXV50683.1 WYL domain-containing protein [Hufsiella arboris]